MHVRRGIEDLVRKECADIVSDALVVGSSRAHPALIVETVARGLDARGRRRVAETVVVRIAKGSAGLFPYERITDPRWVIVGERGCLLRNKVRTWL